MDDLFFSFDDPAQGRVHRFAQMAYTIILEEGFAPNVRKTRLMSQARAQYVTGLVVNARPNIARRDYDRLKATLNNCLRHGPASQNHAAHPDFRAHLLGLLSRFEQVNPARGARLRRTFDAVCWDAKP